MDGNNGSMLGLDFLQHQQAMRLEVDSPAAVEAFVVLCTCVFFVCLNSIMVLAVRSKTAFSETPRYILFNQMLLNDSMQLILTAVLYSFSLTYLTLNKVACCFFVLLSNATFSNSPLILAVMSLERYVAICFPLRHSNIATHRKTNAAMGVVWFFGALNGLIDMVVSFAADPKVSTTSVLCTRELLLVAHWQVSLQQGFSGFYFVVVALTIIFTYVGIMVAARSAKAQKAKRTVLLHMVQLCLCLMSVLYGIIEQALAMVSSKLFSHLRYINFLVILVFPRCLCPLIYGLRDNSVQPVFLSYLRCNHKTVRPVSRP